MIIKGAQVLNEDFEFMLSDLEIEDNIIKKVENNISFRESDMVIDCSDFYVVPGFIDIHIHGCAGFDTCDGTREAIEGMAEFLITKGVTTFCPTTMTVSEDSIEKSMRAVKDCIDNPCSGAAVAGINMEGPFISANRKGAQNEEHVKKPDYNFFKKMMDVSGNNIKIVDIAPEEDGDYTFTRKAKNEAVISLAHSVSGYDKASESFHYGISHATHMFNAMSGFHHRDPGAVGAIFDNDKVTAEIICDGYHVHPAVLRTVFKYMGDRLAVISDSMSAGGLGEGDDFYLGGQKVSVKDGMAHLSDGTIAGSVTNLYDEICNLVKFGIPLEKAVKSATIIPAQIIGIDDITGSIKAGKKADIVVMDKKLNIAAVYH